jgi:hypothetical protein
MVLERLKVKRQTTWSDRFERNTNLVNKNHQDRLSETHRHNNFRLSSIKTKDDLLLDILHE